MNKWSDSANTTVGQCVTVEVVLSCVKDCVVQVAASNPDCSVTHIISELDISTETQNNDAVRSIEVVKIVNSPENCSSRITMIISEDGLTTVSCFVVSGEASIMWASLALD
jgi:hypothetical protein